MTEDEAKTKWCPHVRNGQAGSYERNKRQWGDGGGYIADIETVFVAVNTDAKCIASQCMAWRAVPVKSTNSDGVTIHENGGYCGLAGAPA